MYDDYPDYGEEYNADYDEDGGLYGNKYGSCYADETYSDSDNSDNDYNKYKHDCLYNNRPIDWPASFDVIEGGYDIICDYKHWRSESLRQYAERINMTTPNYWEGFDISENGSIRKRKCNGRNGLKGNQVKKKKEE